MKGATLGAEVRTGPGGGRAIGTPWLRPSHNSPPCLKLSFCIYVRAYTCVCARAYTWICTHIWVHAVRPQSASFSSSVDPNRQGPQQSPGQDGRVSRDDGALVISQPVRWADLLSSPPSLSRITCLSSATNCLAWWPTDQSPLPPTPTVPLVLEVTLCGDAPPLSTEGPLGGLPCATHATMPRFPVGWEYPAPKQKHPLVHSLTCARGVCVTGGPSGARSSRKHLERSIAPPWTTRTSRSLSPAR